MTRRNGEQGIFLSEAVISVFILSTVMLLAFPVLIHIYNERQILQQKQEAIDVLRDQLMQWKTGNPIAPKPEVRTDFTFHWSRKTEHEARLRVSWLYGGRIHELSSEARK